MKYEKWDKALQDFTEHYLTCAECGNVAHELLHGTIQIAGIRRVALHRAKALRSCCETGATMLETIILELEKLD